MYLANKTKQKRSYFLTLKRNSFFSRKEEKISFEDSVFIFFYAKRNKSLAWKLISNRTEIRYQELMFNLAYFIPTMQIVTFNFFPRKKAVFLYFSCKFPDPLQAFFFLSIFLRLFCLFFVWKPVTLQEDRKRSIIL